MNGLLLRAGYGLAPIVLFGTVALISGGGKHRLLVLAIGVALGAVLAVKVEVGDPAANAAAPAAAPGASTDRDRELDEPVTVPAQAKPVDLG